jgi:hypothetical protein
MSNNEKVRFMTRIYKPGGSHLRIVLQAAMPIFEGGQRVGDRPGRYADFANGEYVTDNQADIEKLRSLPGYGVDFTEVSDKEVAQAVASTPTSSVTDDLTAMTKPQIVEWAKAKGIEVDASLTKPQMIEALTK